MTMMKVGYIYDVTHKKTHLGEMVRIYQADATYFRGISITGERIGNEWQLDHTDMKRYWNAIELGPIEDYPEFML